MGLLEFNKLPINTFGRRRLENVQGDYCGKGNLIRHIEENTV